MGDSIWGQRNVPSFFHCTFFIFVLAILRVVVGVCWSIPLTREWERTVIEGKQVIKKNCMHPFRDDSFFMIQDRRKGRELGGFKTYPTALNGKTHHCESLMALAECTNMYSVTFNDWLYRLKTIKTGNMKSGQIATEMKRQLWSMFVLSLTSIANVQIKSSALELDLQVHKENGGGFSFLVTATLVFSVSSFLYDFGKECWKHSNCTLKFKKLSGKNHTMQKQRAVIGGWNTLVATFLWSRGSQWPSFHCTLSSSTAWSNLSWWTSVMVGGTSLSIWQVMAAFIFHDLYHLLEGCAQTLPGVRLSRSWHDSPALV